MTKDKKISDIVSINQIDALNSPDDIDFLVDEIRYKILKSESYQNLIENLTFKSMNINGFIFYEEDFLKEISDRRNKKLEDLGI